MRLENLVRGKQSSLLRILVNYRHKMFYAIFALAKCYKTINVRYLQVLVKSESVCPWQAFQPNLILVDKAKSQP